MNSTSNTAGQDHRQIATRIAAACLFATVALASQLARAAENGTGVYLLGSKGPDAALLPPEGVFLQNDFYLYSGSVSGSKPLPIAGLVTLNASETLPIELPTLIWSTPWTVLGGRVALTASQPIGGPNISADVVAGPMTVHQSDSSFNFGDPQLAALIGWQAGDFHWTSNVMVNVPVGAYDEQALSNLSFHRWAVDVSEAGTYLNAQTGLEASLVAGFTFNGENHATDYRTGTEFHLEGSLTKAFNQQLSGGLVGYYYNQVSADSGSGAVLGPFEGRVAALGVTGAYAFRIGEIPVTMRLKLYREFDAVNRAEGTAAYLTFVMPLWVKR
jgi:hypothetical protein